MKQAELQKLGNIICLLIGAAVLVTFGGSLVSQIVDGEYYYASTKHGIEVSGYMALLMQASIMIVGLLLLLCGYFGLKRK